MKYPQLPNASGVCGWYFAPTMTPLADAVACGEAKLLTVTRAVEFVVSG
ncbi:MAG: hypothetical protein GY742_22510 [Hyphomicrobiales bacterium]|nr:hypothetical protein [Hyphomicrobiales bacterium]